MSATKRPWFPERAPVLEQDGTISRAWNQYFRELPNFSDGVVPTGTIDGANKIFTLSEAPNPTESLKVWTRTAAATSWTLNALTTGYTLSGKTVTFVTAPAAGSLIQCDYRTKTQSA